MQALKDDIKRRVSYIRESLNNINRCDLNNKETQTDLNLSNSVVEKKGIKKDLELIEEEDNESRVSTVQPPTPRNDNKDSILPNEILPASRLSENMQSQNQGV